MTYLSILTYFLGMIAAFAIAWIYHRIKMGGYQRHLNQLLESTQKEIESQKHQDELKRQQEDFEHQKKCGERSVQLNKKIEEEKKKLERREEKINLQQKKNDKLSQDLNSQLQQIRKQQEDFLFQKQQVLDQKQKLVSELEKVSKLTQKEAEEKLIEKISLKVKKDCALWSSRFLKETKEGAQKRASKIISDAIHRLTVSTTSAATITTIALPNEEMKARIIGREGRNINHLENILGVNLLMDETPKTVIVSSLDPMRKAVAKETLKQLILDGRIHPTRIEEEHQNAQLTIEKRIYQKAEDMAIRLGITDLHPKMLRLMGKLDLMDSIGQNILDHSYQVALLLGLMAAELGLNTHLAKRIGFLHDIGKAAPPEMSGSHALIGQKLARQYGESEDVANGIATHHDEVPPISIEGSLCSSADAISASRPGARSESLQHYFKRVKKLEEIALSFPEVEKAYALQAGREIRVFTEPDKIDDASIHLLAQSIAHKVQKELNYPHQIKVSVMRQQQIVEYTQ